MSAEVTNAETMMGRLADIAQMTPPMRNPALEDLVQDCRDGKFPQTKTDLKNMLKDMLAKANDNAIEAGEANLVGKINKDWFLLGEGNKVRIGKLGDDGKLTLLTKTDFCTWVAPMSTQTGENSPGEVWLRSPNRKQYSGVVCDPALDREADGKINVWTGYGVDPVAGDPKPFVDYARLILGNGNDAFGEYVLDWLAYKIQNPTKPVGTALMLFSEQEGTGKSTLGWIMRELFKHHSRILSATAIAAKHNSWMVGAMFIQCDEVNLRKFSSGMDRVKVLITSDKVEVEPKGVDSFAIDNCCGLLLTTNKRDALPTGRSDRRLAMNEVSVAEKQNARYWKPFYGWLENEGGLAIILDYLQKRDVSEWNAQRDRPVTALYLESKRASLRNVHGWWSACVNRRQLLGGSSQTVAAQAPQSSGWAGVGKDVVYGMYCDWEARQREPDRPMGRVEFWIAMHEMGAVKDERKPKSGPRQVEFVDWEVASEGVNSMLSS